ncbi:DUF6266 family protein [Bacteroides helcogenes]|uniref:Uncharacterized protein n=1 Tax=Bacteroides helcogenes (strain ATCC 35417 / DSM 20613 / JCM 6297 / CCUG 15421 / P 36-108) TaxID=693979 RepID=E6SPJ3_BACT6|nr:DUF6266 family protein [Bacteroides helcogenes]ADV42882.1 hypothetical protein Bache_0865 [Bacteroides helcogenes P 36-108]MDY5238213.1 DUF6266 family protein [Bacteroides helcogenes]
MGTIKQGILGGFSGKVGTVVGSNWKSVHYMRALALKVGNPNTEKQQRQRNNFSTVIQFLKTFTPIIRIGYQQYAQKQSEFNAAMSYVIKHAIVNDAIDYTRALVSRGSLTTAADATASVEAGKVSYVWKNNSGTGNAEAGDTAILLAYNKDKREAVYTIKAATRSEAKAELTLPAGWSGNALALYLGFYNDKSVANSICLKNDDAGSTIPDSGAGGDENENPLG